MLTDEWYLVSRIKLTGARCIAFDKHQTLEERKSDIRAAITINELTDRHCWFQKGKPVTFADAFTEVFLEKL